MFNSLGLSQFGTYLDIKKRIIQHMQSAKVDDQVFDTVKKLFEKTLCAGNVILSRPERDRLLSQVMKSILTDMLAKLG